MCTVTSTEADSPALRVVSASASHSMVAPAPACVHVQPAELPFSSTSGPGSSTSFGLPVQAPGPRLVKVSVKVQVWPPPSRTHCFSSFFFEVSGFSSTQSFTPPSVTSAQLRKASGGEPAGIFVMTSTSTDSPG